MAPKKDLTHFQNLSCVARLDGYRTATYCVIVDNTGEVKFGIGDMDVHTQINAKYVSFLTQ